MGIGAIIVGLAIVWVGLICPIGMVYTQKCTTYEIDENNIEHTYVKGEYSHSHFTDADGTKYIYSPYRGYWSCYKYGKTHYFIDGNWYDKEPNP